MEQTSSFGYWLRRRRKALDLTQGELAQRIGCALGTVKKLETDERRPSKQLAERVADLLQISPDERAAFLKAARAELATDQLEIAQPSIEPVYRPTTNLPAHTTPFIGREREIAELEHLFCDPVHRLITLLGPGGMGKTALAVEVVRRQVGRFADGVYFVSLAPLNSSEDFVAAVAKALDVHCHQQDRPSIHVLDYLRTKSICLVLDNFEHLRSSVEFVTEMLQAAPGLRLLVTSREALGALSETRYTLQGLALPTTPATLSENSCIRLFLHGAQRAQPTFTPSADDMVAIAEIARRVDGMPLALLLAGAWITVLSVADICAEIEQNVDFLAGDSLDVPERQRSIRAVFLSTWRRLTEGERTIFARVTVFRGGFTREAAQHVADASLLILRGLADKSLVQYNSATQRYDIHELLRQYGDEQLGAHRDDLRQRHAEYYTEFAEQADRGIKSSEQPRWVRRLGEEQHNFRAALRWLLERRAVELTLRLSDALWGLWLILGYIAEGKRWLEAALAQSDAALEQGMVTATHLTARANVLITLGFSHYHVRDFDRAIATCEQAYQIHSTLANEQGQVDARIALGLISRSLPDPRNAAQLLEESLARARAIQYRYGTYRALHFLGGWYLRQGDFALAEAFLAQSLPLAREQGDLWAQGFMLIDLARIKFVQGDYVGAQGLYRETLTMHAQLGQIFAIRDSFVGLACVAIAMRTSVELIATLLGAAKALSTSLGSDLDITAIMHDDQYAAYVQEHRAAPVFASAWARGRTMQPTDAVEYALRVDRG
jgi:predicted ATPase/DNA-binding XRE family transcriptional regulator